MLLYSFVSASDPWQLTTSLFAAASDNTRVGTATQHRLVMYISAQRTYNYDLRLCFPSCFILQGTPVVTSVGNARLPGCKQNCPFFKLQRCNVGVYACVARVLLRASRFPVSTSRLSKRRNDMKTRIAQSAVGLASGGIDRRVLWWRRSRCSARVERVPRQKAKGTHGTTNNFAFAWQSIAIPFAWQGPLGIRPLVL